MRCVLIFRFVAPRRQVHPLRGAPAIGYARVMSYVPLPDAARQNWVDRHAPEGLKPWLKLGASGPNNGPMARQCSRI